MDRAFVFPRCLAGGYEHSVTIAGRRGVAVVKSTFAIRLSLTGECGLSLQDFISKCARNCIPGNVQTLCRSRCGLYVLWNAGSRLLAGKVADLRRDGRNAAGHFACIDAEFLRREDLFEHCTMLTRCVGVCRITRIKHLVGDDHRVACLDHRVRRRRSENVHRHHKVAFENIRALCDDLLRCAVFRLRPAESGGLRIEPIKHFANVPHR